MNYVQYKNYTLPIFNTPLSNVELQELREKYDKFLVKDVRLGSVKLVTNAVQVKRFRIDFGFRPMVYTTALVLAVYNYIQIKKKVKKVAPFSWGGSITEFVKDIEKPNGAKVVEL
ncbi:MAG: hypothetical protein [Circular genetic element sp.]|nr:MAG: hypothetical protein [Circular genetic element sp.]